MYKVFIISPIYAALAFTLPQSYAMLHKPDIIWIPVFFDLFFFGIGYIVFGLINAFIIAPLCIGITALTASRAAGLFLACAVAALGTYIVFASQIFGHKLSIIHSAYLLGAFLPLFLTTAVSFYFAYKYRRAARDLSGET